MKTLFLTLILFCSCSNHKNKNDIFLLGDDKSVVGFVSDVSRKYYCYLDIEEKRTITVCRTNKKEFSKCNTTSDLVLSNGQRIPIIPDNKTIDMDCIEQAITGGAIGVKIDKNNKVLSVMAYQ